MYKESKKYMTRRNASHGDGGRQQNEPHLCGRPNIIKVGSLCADLRVSEYRSVLEEIEADEMTGVRVNIGDVLETYSQNEKANQTEAPDQESLRRALNEAFEHGFEAGKNEASRVLQSEYEKKIAGASENFKNLLGEFTREMDEHNKELDKAVITLALAIARRVVSREIEIDEGAVLARTREAIRRIIGVDKIKIHVNPADENYVRERRSELSDYADSVKEIVIEADDKVERGGCMIESELGNIDAKISTQFGIIEEALLGIAKR